MTEEEQLFAYKELRNNGQAFFVDNYEDADRIIDALEKQIPKKVDVRNSIHHYCPSCDLYFDSRDWKSKHCGRCGQAIKWE